MDQMLQYDDSDVNRKRAINLPLIVTVKEGQASTEINC